MADKHGGGVPLAEIVAPERFGHWIEQKQAAFDAIMREYDVQLFFADRMRSVLCGSKKVIIIDNSGSMNSGVSNTRR